MCPGRHNYAASAELLEYRPLIVQKMTESLGFEASVAHIYPRKVFERMPTDCIQTFRDDSTTIFFYVDRIDSQGEIFQVLQGAEGVAERWQCRIGVHMVQHFSIHKG